MKVDVGKLMAIWLQVALVILTTGSTGAREIELHEEGGIIRVKQLKKTRSNQYMLSWEHWKYHHIMRVDVFVIQPSANDNLTISGVGQVKTSGCFLLTQVLPPLQEDFSDVCILQEARAQESGCTFAKDVTGNFRVFTKIERSPTKGIAYVFTYKLLSCDADLTISPTPPSVFKKTTTTARARTNPTSVVTSTSPVATTYEETTAAVPNVVNARRIPVQPTYHVTTATQRIPQASTSQEHVYPGTTPAGGETAAVVCERCGKHTIIIALCIMFGLIIFVAMIVAVLLCRRDRKKKTPHQSLVSREESTIRPFSFGTSATTIPRNDLQVTFHPQLRREETRERYVLTPINRTREEPRREPDEIDFAKATRVDMPQRDSWSSVSSLNENEYNFPDENPNPTVPPLEDNNTCHASTRQSDASSPFERGQYAATSQSVACHASTRQLQASPPFERDQSAVTSQSGALSRFPYNQSTAGAYANLASTSNPDYQNLTSDVETNMGGYVKMGVLPNAETASADCTDVQHLYETLDNALPDPNRVHDERKVDKTYSFAKDP